MAGDFYNVMITSVHTPRLPYIFQIVQILGSACGSFRLDQVVFANGSYSVDPDIHVTGCTGISVQYNSESSYKHVPHVLLVQRF